MDTNELWEIESMDSTKAYITLKKGNSTLELYAIVPPPTSWSVGDKVTEPKLKEDARSDRRVTIANKTNGGQITADILKASGDILKSLSLSEEMEYPNFYKRQNIEASEKGAIRLWDDSVWYIDKDRSLPTDEVLNEGDVVSIEPAGAARPGDKIKSYKVVKNPKKSGFKVTWLNPTDKTIKNLSGYTLEKSGRKGTIDDAYYGLPDIELGDTYLDEWLGRKWTIKSIRSDSGYDDEKDEYFPDHSIIVADLSRYGSEWKITRLNFSKDNFRKWQEGQAVRISKRKSGITTYWMENMNVPDNEVGVSFAGWAKSEFNI